MSEGASPQPEMTPERWHQIRDLLADAILLPAKDRPKYLARVCGSDSARRAELESLIAAHDIAEGGAFDKPALEMTAAVPGVDSNRVRELFENVLALGPARRTAFLAQNCANDRIRQLVETLLHQHQETGVRLQDDSTLGLLTEAHIAEVEDPMVGRRLGAYRLVKRIGQGGMAAVYLAVRADEEYQKEVAIKLVQPGLDRRELLNRFRNERQTLAGLDHPNIVKLLDGGSTPEGLPFLVMDYVEGRPIDDYCDGLKLTIDERLRLFSKICEAVHHAHQKGIVHRDLKPSNILVIADGTPKLLDFGIAKVLAPTAETLVVTHTQTRCMTPAYASPEQVRGQAVTPATDIYSLGVVLYELLTGHRPYRLKEHTPAEMEQAICEQEPETPSTAVSRVESETSSDGTAVTKTAQLVSQTREGQAEKLRRRLRGDLDNILLKALCKEPGRRYGSVQEFAGDIDRHLKHLPVTARPSSLGYRTSKFVRRHKTEAAASVVGVFLLAAAVIFAVGALRMRERLPSEAPTPRIRSLAVLPLANLSGDPAQEYFSDGMTDALITDLSQIHSLKVISRTSSMQYKQTKKSLPEIARELNVDGIVEGTVQRSGDRVRITAQLIHGPSDKHLWANNYERDTHDVLTLEREVTGDIARQIRVQLTPEKQEQPANPRPMNLEALEAYLQGNYRLNEAWRKPYDKELRTAGEYFQHAIDAQPDFAPAYIGLAEAHHLLLWPSSEDFALMKQAVEKAVALAPASSEARTELALTKWEDWDWSGAEEEYRRAVTLNPNNANAHDGLGDCISDMGRLEEGWKEKEIAQALDPGHDHLSEGLYRRGQYDRSIELFQKSLGTQPEDASFHYFLSQNYIQEGMYAAWAREINRALTMVGFPKSARRIQQAFTSSGYQGALRQEAREMEGWAATGQSYMPGNLAQIYTSLGDKDRAFYWLGQGVDHHHMAMVDMLNDFKIDPRLAPLHSDPRFEELLRRAGLPP